MKKCEWPNLNDDFVLLNPLSSDSDRMRPSLLPSALQSVALNQKNYHQFQFFELGRSYIALDSDISRDNFVQELSQLVVCFFDKKENRFQQIIDETENLLRYLNLSFKTKSGNISSFMIDCKWAGCHPFEYQNVQIMGENLGVIFSIHPLMLKKFKIKRISFLCTY